MCLCVCVGSGSDSGGGDGDGDAFACVHANFIRTLQFAYVLSCVTFSLSLSVDGGDGLLSFLPLSLALSLDFA